MGEKENAKLVNKILEEERGRNKLNDVSVLEPELEDNDFSKAIRSFIDKIHLAEQFIDIIPIHYDKNNLWWVWDFCKKCYVLTDEVDILNKIDYSSPANIINSKERNEIIIALRQVARRNKPKDIKETWLQFKEEIIDIESGERFLASPEYFITNPIPHKLGRSSETPTIDRIFEEWVGGDHVKTLYEIISYCMIPSYPLHRLFCFIGSGMNGKSCFLSLLKKFIGIENCTSTELDTLLNSRFEITKLHKKLVCLMGETNFNEMSKTSMLKKLTGGDLIGYEYKNKTPFEAYNYAKIIIATNNLPTTTDKTIGFYRRWMIIDFPNQFTEKVEVLDRIPEEEYNNLGLKCVGILMDLLKKREFHKEGTIEERKERYESKSNFLQSFMEKFISQEENGYITKGDFFKKFSGWSKEHRHRELSETSVGLQMKKMGIESEKKHFDWMYDGKGGQARIWRGIKWKE